jgi:hypothetical protein
VATPPLKGGEWGRFETNLIPLLPREEASVGAVYDRAFFPGINEIRAVIDRAYMAAPSNKCREASLAAQTGWLVIQIK